MKTSALVALIALAAFGASSAMADQASTPAPAPVAKPYPKGISCGYVSDSQGFGVIDDRHLIIDGTFRKKFLVTLMTRCFDLETAFGIRLDRRGADLCTGDAIRAGRSRCSIQHVEEIRSAQEGHDLVTARAAADEAERKTHH